MGNTLENMSQEEIEERLPELFSELSEQKMAEESHLHSLVDAYEKENDKQSVEPEKAKKTITHTEYSSLYCDWLRLHINERDYESDCDKKTKSLLRFYKFRKNGKQPIFGYSCRQIGHLYANVLEHARKSVRQ